MKQPNALLPFVPSGPDYEGAKELFRLLGFTEEWENAGYSGWAFGPARFILMNMHNPEFTSHFMIKLVVDDVEAWWAGYQEIAEEVARRFPGFRIKPPYDYAWGREVHFIDPAGVCWHVGLE